MSGFSLRMALKILNGYENVFLRQHLKIFTLLLKLVSAFISFSLFAITIILINLDNALANLKVYNAIPHLSGG
jgi:hypothetical protein